MTASRKDLPLLRVPDNLPDSESYFEVGEDFPRLITNTISADRNVEVPLESEGFDLLGVLSELNQTAYIWDIASDQLDWESNACRVLSVGTMSEVSSGAAYDQLVAPEHFASRLDAIIAASAESAKPLRGGSYRLQYRFFPKGPRNPLAIWLEDYGRWWPDRDGRPARARGTIRAVHEGFVEEQRRLFNKDHDELTGQLTRAHLMEALAAVMGRSERRETPCAVLLASINNLAAINETFGFETGDSIIATVGRLIKTKLRGGDVLGRYSSNKFGMIICDCGPEAMHIAADRIRTAVRKEVIEVGGHQISTTLSMGGACCSSQRMTPNQAMNSALMALEKAQGNAATDQFVGYQPNLEIECRTQRNRQIANEIIEALEQNRMKLALQPVVCSKSGEFALYECLVRMEQENGEHTHACDFVPVAEQLGLARLVDSRTLEMAIALLKKHPKLNLAINVSSLTTADMEWLATLRDLSGEDRTLTSRLVVEITETTAIHDLNQTMAFVDTLKEYGCRTALDDFGAGYTSFKNLKHLAVDIVKIDGSFVKNVMSDTSDQVFVKTMVELAQKFGMETVAECVSDGDSAELLVQLGVTYLQGYHCGKPINAEEIKLLS